MTGDFGFAYSQDVNHNTVVAVTAANVERHLRVGVFHPTHRRRPTINASGISGTITGQPRHFSSGGVSVASGRVHRDGGRRVVQPQRQQCRTQRAGPAVFGFVHDQRRRPVRPRSPSPSRDVALRQRSALGGNLTGSFHDQRWNDYGIGERADRHQHRQRRVCGHRRNRLRRWNDEPQWDERYADGRRSIGFGQFLRYRKPDRARAHR